MFGVSAGRAMRRSFATSSKIIFSGIQPSGIPHIGNYFGALKNWVDEQKEGRGDLFFSMICRVQALLLWNHVVPRTDIVSRSSDVKRQHKVGNGCDHSSEQRFSVPLGLRTGAKRQNGAVHPVGRSIPIGLCLLECVPL